LDPGSCCGLVETESDDSRMEIFDEVALALVWRLKWAKSTVKNKKAPNLQRKNESKTIVN
jgi:hypothetical protein